MLAKLDCLDLQVNEMEVMGVAYYLLFCIC